MCLYIYKLFPGFFSQNVFNNGTPVNEKSGFSGKISVYQKAFFITKSHSSLPLREEAMLHGQEVRDRPRAGLSVCTAAAGGRKMRAGQAHEES